MDGEKLQEQATEITREELSNIYKKAKDLFEEEEWLMSQNEKNFIQEELNQKKVSTPYLTLKDHKKPNAEGDYDQRLICKADHFMSCLSTLGYIIIKNVLKKNDIKTDTYRIYNAAQFKEEMEELKPKKN